MVRDDKGLDATTTLLNVAVAPPAPVVGAVVEMSRELAGRGGLFELDNHSRHPHLTLYMARFDIGNLDEIRARLRDAVRGVRPFRVVHCGYHVTPGNYHEISYTRDETLCGVHEKITNALRGRRYSPGRPVVEDYFGEYSAAQQANARDVGYDLAGELYRPHITLTRVKEGVTAEPLAVRADLSFTASTVGLFEADRLGAARRLIESLELN
ncbi:2'-5' RNA ligase family protein [Actinophytocola sp.]|uniref:2'-5' RNA ligase family protein n=1 Tax=Actinophytocola sp. TaxID=1872138 RepID=UPI00389A0BB8